MALSTSYYTVDGEIVGESSNGTRLDYLSDALGSVTAKVNQSGAVASSARYKPYGNKLAGSDYTFGWVGSFGYRKNSTGFYVRSRHYQASQSSWSSVDKFWPSEANYVYANCSPIDSVDVLGMKPTRTRVHTKFEDCGGMEIYWKFSCEKGETGWLVQRIESSGSRWFCEGGPPIVGCAFDTYYEAWRVVNGSVQIPLGDSSTGYWIDDPVTDSWTRNANPCTHGSIQMRGSLHFYPDNLAGWGTSPSDYTWLIIHNFGPGVRGCSGELPMSLTPPRGFSGSANAHAYIDWGCCKSKCGTECKKCEDLGPCFLPSWGVTP